VYRAPGAGIAELRELEATQGGCWRLAAIYQAGTVTEAEMQRDNFARKWTRLPHGESDLAPELGTDHSVFRVSRRDPESDLHDQHDRVAEHVAAQNHQDARSFPNEEAAMKLLYLALRNASKKWTMRCRIERGTEPFQHLWPERMPAWTAPDPRRRKTKGKEHC